MENRSVAHTKQHEWRMKQMNIFYGTGRPLFKITKDNMFVRKGYDVNYYRENTNWLFLDNKNFVAYNKRILHKKLNLSNTK